MKMNWSFTQTERQLLEDWIKTMNKNTHRIVPIEETNPMLVEGSNFRGNTPKTWETMLEASPVNSDAYFDAVEGLREALEAVDAIAKGDRERIIKCGFDFKQPIQCSQWAKEKIEKALAAYDKITKGNENEV